MSLDAGMGLVGGQVSPPLQKRRPIQTMESHSVLNRNELLSPKEGDLTCMSLREGNHSEIILCDSNHTMFFTDTERRWAVAVVKG